jgi:hypothetical protein
MVLLEHQVQAELQVLLEHQVQVVLQELVELQVLLELTVQVVQMVHRVLAE